MTPKKRAMLEIRQQETYLDMVKCLAANHMCNVERPTGFGKTKLFAQYIAAHPTERTLYIYDVNAARASFESKYPLNNVEFMSYSRLSMSKSSEATITEILLGKYKTIIFDESHLMGGQNINKLVTELIPKALEDGCDIIGGTATPLRYDLVDVTNKYFKGSCPKPYTLGDAFDDGLMEVPLYTVMIYSRKRLENDKQRYRQNAFAMKRLKQLEYAYAQRNGADSIYRDSVLKMFGEVPNRMKFVVFYPTIESMNESAGTLAKEFQDAFPEREIVITPVSSDPEHTGNYEDIFVERDTPNTIELITAVNMLNQAYHAEDLTGIVMNRTTLSNVLYTQQLGRCLSVQNDKPALVFDNVANCDQNPLQCLDEIQKFKFFNKGNGKKTGVKMQFFVSPEERKFLDWSERIRSTKNVTQNMIDEAKWYYTKMDAPLDYVEKKTRVPGWLLQEELKAEGKSLDEADLAVVEQELRKLNHES